MCVRACVCAECPLIGILSPCTQHGTGVGSTATLARLKILKKNLIEKTEKKFHDIIISFIKVAMQIDEFG